MTAEGDFQLYIERLVETEKILCELVSFYKQQSQEYRGVHAREIVWAATMVFISHLYLRMVSKR